jgi:hypothetical protein
MPSIFAYGIVSPIRKFAAEKMKFAVFFAWEAFGSGRDDQCDGQTQPQPMQMDLKFGCKINVY